MHFITKLYQIKDERTVMSNKKLLSAAMGNCVHVAGIAHFSQIAEQEGFDCIFLGPAVPIDNILKAVVDNKPNMVAISYRLTPNVAQSLLNEFVAKAKQLPDCESIKWLFGGISPNARIAEEFDFFDYISYGTDDMGDVISYLRGMDKNSGGVFYPQNIIERIENKYPYPLLRHHYGEPSLDKTLEGIKQIAEAKCLDIISIGPDQNTQQFFFQQEKISSTLDGAGGVPLRTVEDFISLKKASQFGNLPLMRCYSGTEEVERFAELLVDTINNAWCAVPLCWYNELDGRGTRTLEVSIKEAQELMKWHSLRNIPIEVNEPHHWGLRDAPDVISVVMAYISAYNAKKAGVSHYIAQYMFNVPNGISFSVDLAKNLAMVELVESLEDAAFKTYRQVRAGLPFLSADLELAKGQLASSTYLSMALKPHIIHVVGYCEAEQIATPQVVIESSKIVKGVIKSILLDQPDATQEPKIMKRKAELLAEAKYTLDYILNSFSDLDDPLANPYVLSESIKRGVLDAPHILKTDMFKGNIYTTIVDGRCVAFDKVNKTELSEAERIARLK